MNETSHRGRKISPARQAAFDVLRKVAEEKGFSAILLPVAEESLSAEDCALCHQITLGVLRNQLWLDLLIEHFSGKKIAKLDLPVVLALRIALFQIRFLTKIPPRAAVNEAVNQVYAARLSSAAAFVNAILRRAAREKDFDPTAKVANALEKLSIETSHPIWLLQKWQEQFGFAETAALARIHNVAPPIAFRVANAQSRFILEELRKAGAEIVESKVAPAAWRVRGAAAEIRKLAALGKIYLQDEASQLVAYLAAVAADELFLDVCAAPGSKTTLVANLRQDNSKFKTIAGDFSAPRVRILRQIVKRFAHGKVEIVRYDAEQNLPFAAEIFDCVLVDAPCSGTGTIRHNPEIRWHLQKTDFAELGKKQLRILENAARAAKKDGRVIFSTCSLEPEEGENVVNQFLIQNPNFKIIAPPKPNKFLRHSSLVRTFPPRDDVDGFFAAILKKSQPQK
jgi:16S rRNA (cytosine967-C5)-methyltransferase